MVLEGGRRSAAPCRQPCRGLLAQQLGEGTELRPVNTSPGLLALALQLTLKLNPFILRKFTIAAQKVFRKRTSAIGSLPGPLEVSVTGY